MGQVHTVFTSDDADVIKSLQRQASENARLREANRKLTEETKRGAREAKQSTDGHVTALGQMAASLLTVQTVVGSIKQAYSEWTAEQEKLAKATTSFHQRLIKDLALAGDLAQSPRIERFLNTTGNTREEGRAALAGVTGAAPLETLDRRLALTQAALQVDALGIDLTDFGKLVGELSQALPKETAGNIADLALVLKQMGGDREGQVSSPAFLRGVAQLQQSGADPNTALSFGLAALDAQLKPAILGQIATKLQKEHANLGDVLYDPARAREVLGDETASQVALIDRQRGADLFATLADSQGAIGRDLAALPGTAAGRAALAADNLETLTEAATRDRGLQAQGFAQMREFLEARAAEGGAGPLGQFAARRNAGLLTFLGEQFGASPEAAMRSSGLPESEISRFRQQTGRDQLTDDTGAARRIHISEFKPVVDLLQQIRDALAGPGRRPAIIEPREQ